MIVKNKLHRRISDSIVSLFSSLDESNEDTGEGADYEDDLMEALDRELSEMDESESEEED